MASLHTRLNRKQTATLAAVTAAAIAALAALPLFSLLSGGRFASWCRETMSQMVSLDLSVIAVAAITAFSTTAVATTLAKELVGTLRLRRSVATTALPRPGKVSAALAAIGQSDASVTVVRDLRPYAYAFGVRNRTVVLSSALVSSFSLEETKTVLRHELRHLASRHPMRALLWELACRAFFFLPALRDIAEHFALARELDADRSATEGKSGRRALASALMKASAPGVAGVAAFVSFGHLQGRIDALHGEQGAPIRIDHLRAAVSAMAIVCTMVAVAPAYAASPASSPRCREEIDRQVGTFILAPFSKAFPPGPSSTEAVVQSREIVP